MIEVITGDCTKILVTKPVDIQICDPPYSDHVHRNATSQSIGGGTRHRDLGFDCLSPELRKHIAHISAHIPRWSIIYSDVEGIHDWKFACEDAGATYIRPVPWVRWSMPQLSGDRPPQGCEFIICFWGSQKGRKSWNGPGNLTHLSHTCLRGDGKHKTEKPLDQMLDLVSYFSNPGDHVLDVCCGSGTTGLACKLLGRSFTGIEIDPEWAEKAKTRIMSDKLSERDEERFKRWSESQEIAWQEKQRIKKNTNKVRKKLDAKKVEVFEPETVNVLTEEQIREALEEGTKMAAEVRKQTETMAYNIDWNFRVK